MNFVDCILLFEGITIGFGSAIFSVFFLVHSYLLSKHLFSIFPIKSNKAKCPTSIRCQCSCDCVVQFLSKGCTQFMTSVIKGFLPDNVYSASLDGSTVVVVNGFILNQRQLFGLSAACMFLCLTFGMIIVRNSFITIEISRFSACFTGGLIDNIAYKSCLIFKEYDPIGDNNISELTASDCANLNCEECPNTTLNDGSQYNTIICHRKIPNIITAIAGLVGLVNGTKLILSIYSSVMFKVACMLVGKPQRMLKVFKTLWVYSLQIPIIIGSAANFFYIILDHSAPTKKYMYLCEIWMYIMGLVMFMLALPWSTSQRYVEEIKTLDKKKIKEKLFENKEKLIIKTEKSTLLDPNTMN